VTDHARITTRIAVPTDADSVARIARDAYAHYTSRIGRPPAPMTADYVDLIVRGTVWVAESGAQLLGLLVLVDRPDHLLLDNIAVGPDAQGRGVGALLLKLAEREGLRRGHTEIRLYTNEAMTENLDYYPRRGYRETHRGAQDGYQRVYFTKTLTAVPR
jgi:GNAT superfamily N-acetyltransferase